ncbi:MAG TPA: hypothetical protein VLI90_20795 [Tepidisphaeraceae bacterium]|nr:hypothetical protein [Tepidisphaeraceae bacterium]
MSERNAAFDFRQQFLAAESFDPALRQKYQLEVKAMFEHKLTKMHRLVYVFTGLLSIAIIVLFAVISFQLPQRFPPLARAAFGLGILFALGWAIQSYRIVRRGSVKMRKDPRTMAALVWVFIVLMVTINMVLAGRAGDRIWGVQIVVNSLVFLVGAAVFLIGTIVQQAQMQTQEKLLEIEYRLAELTEQIKRPAS